MSATSMIWAGRVLSGLFVLFMLGASVTPKLAGMPVAAEAMTKLGWDPRHVLAIGLIELACTVLYVIPRTSITGAILTTALLGGAIATQWRADQPLFSHTLFGIYLGLIMWGGLWLRSPELRALFPWRML